MSAWWAESPMPFGGEYGWEPSPGLKWGTSPSSHQCLSAGSTVGRMSAMGTRASIILVTNAFRRGVRLGVLEWACEEHAPTVTNAFRRGVRLGEPRVPEAQRGNDRSPMPFGGEYGWEPP